MSIIGKKVLPKYFKRLLTGNKNLKLQLNNFICKKVTYLTKFKIGKFFLPKSEIENKVIQIIALK